MKRESRPVAYSHEHGNESLPYLKDMVSDTPDPKKSKIMAYLKTHCPIACSAVIPDEIDPQKIIGAGDLFSDGTYLWNDVFANYVDRYNIPVPKEFRQHILDNFDNRMNRHTLFRLIDSVEIWNNPYLGYIFYVCICKNGVIRYQNSEDCADGAVMYIKPEDAQYIIDPIMTEIFCYDADEHGKAIIDGYHWRIAFYRDSELVDVIEGWPDEDPWRYGEVKSIIEFAERYISKDLGSQLMEWGRTGE